MSTEQTTTQTGTGTEQTQQGEWYGSFQDDLKGYVQNKGFKDPASVVESYRNLEKLVGVKDKLLQVPDDLGSKDMDSVWNRLGRPTKAEEYGFKSADETFDKWAKDSFYKAGLTANQAKAVVEQYDAFVNAQNSELKGKFVAENEAKTNKLKQEWGNAFDQNVNMAKSAAKQFGISTDMIDSMEKSIGFEPVMRLLQSIGAKVGEADFVNSSTTGNSFKGILSPAQAQERINQLTNDADWARKYVNGDVQARNEMEKLAKMATNSYE